MPATAGRVRMPANNRVHSSAALQTHDIWRSAIGYDPYAPTTDDNKSRPDNSAGDAYASFRGLLTLARITNSNCDETRGACKKCGRVGHLTYHCRNFLSFKDAKPNDDAALRNAKEIMEEIKKGDGIEEKRESDDDDDDDDEISSSDSDVDPEIEGIIAERYGVKMSGKAYTSSDDEEKRKKRSHHHHHRHHHHKKRRRTRHHHHHHHHYHDDESDSDRGYKRKKRSRRGNHHEERRSVLSSGSESTGSSSEEDERTGRGRHRGRSKQRKD